MKPSNDQIDLEKLDFTPNDAVVYRFLLKEGASPAGNIIAKTSFHRNIVYTALDHLIHRKVVSEKKAGSKTIYEAVTPDILVTEYKEKEEMAESLVEEFKRLNANKTAQEISVHQGNDEYLRLLTSIIESMPEGSTKYVLGSGGEAFMKHTMRPIWTKYHDIAKEAGIHIKMLGYSSQKASIQPDLKDLSMYEVRYIDSKNQNPAGIHIYPEIDTILNIIYSTDNLPVTAIRIKNKELAEGYLNLFNNLWKTAE